MPDALKAFWIAFGVSAICAYPCLLLLRRMRSVSETYEFAPETHKHKTGTPNMGGIFVLIGVLLGSCALQSQLLVQELILVGGFGLIGFVDDFLIKRMTGKRGLSWRVKLILQFAAGAGYAATLSFSTESLLEAFLIITFANAYNFADGLDALAGSVLVALLVPYLVFAQQAGLGVSIIISALLGGILPFLAVNAPPAKVFMGDVGALPIGALLGMILVQMPYQVSVWPWVPTLLLVVELVMVPIQVIAVKTIKRRVFASTPVHHAFEVKGWAESRIVWTFFCFQILLSAVALSLFLK